MVDGMQARAMRLSKQVATARQHLADEPPGLFHRAVAKVSPVSAGVFGYLPEDLYPQRGLAGQVTSDMRMLDSMLDLLQQDATAAAVAPSTI
jgi:hypothetical protein